MVCSDSGGVGGGSTNTRSNIGGGAIVVVVRSRCAGSNGGTVHSSGW